MGCATSVVKYILFLFNLIFVLAGLAIVALGVLLRIGFDQSKDPDVKQTFLPVILILLIVVGVVVFLIAFFGCCGAIRESTCMLTTYAVILLVLFIVQLAFAIYMFVEVKEGKDSLQDITTITIRHDLERYNVSDFSRESMDNRQTSWQCCGIHGPGDWRTIFPNSDAVPKSCCMDNVNTCSAHANVYTEGCATVGWKFIKRYGKMIGIVAIVIAATELGGAIVALCLASSIRNHERRGW